MTPKYLILAATIPRVPQHTLRTVRTRNSTLETSLTLVPPRPTGRRTQQELRHGGPSAGTYATRSAPAHPVRPPGLPTSLGASLPTQRPARTAHRPPRRAGVGQALPACVRVTAFYLSVPVRAFSSALEAEYSSGIFTAKVQSSEFIRAYQQQTDIFTAKTHAAKLSRTQPGRCGRCRCWGRPR